MKTPAFLLAPGAGAPSSHPRMLRSAELLRAIGPVHAFDYPYMLAGRKRPDPLPILIEAHRAALKEARSKLGRPIVLVGKSMGSRVGCHLSLTEDVPALVCLGYPLCGAGDRTKLRDAVLRQMRSPVLFIQGTRDPLCPLDLLGEVRAGMSARSELHVVQGGDHSLIVSKAQQKASGTSQDQSDDAIGSVIRSFVSALPG